MGDISLITQLRFNNGRFIGRATHGGTVTEERKTGPVDCHYQRDAVILADAKGRSIAGPVDMSTALQLATSVINGHPLAVTDPLMLNLICSCFLALADDVAPLNLNRNKAVDPDFPII